MYKRQHLQRRYLAPWSPRSALVGLGGPALLQGPTNWSVFPAVLKPVGREASSGVQRVDGPDALARALADYEPGEALLLEELVAGHEVSVETLVQGGRVLFSSITGKLTTEATSSFFVEMGHTVPDPEHLEPAIGSRREQLRIAAGKHGAEDDDGVWLRDVRTCGIGLVHFATPFGWSLLRGVQVVDSSHLGRVVMSGHRPNRVPPLTFSTCPHTQPASGLAR